MPLPDELGQPGRPDRNTPVSIDGFTYVISSKEIRKGELFLYLAPKGELSPNPDELPCILSICIDDTDKNIIKGITGNIQFVALRSKCARLTHTIPLNESEILN